MNVCRKGRYRSKRFAFPTGTDERSIKHWSHSRDRRIYRIQHSYCSYSRIFRSIVLRLLLLSARIRSICMAACRRHHARTGSEVEQRVLPGRLVVYCVFSWYVLMNGWYLCCRNIGFFFKRIVEFFKKSVVSGFPQSASLASCRVAAEVERGVGGPGVVVRRGAAPMRRAGRRCRWGMGPAWCSGAAMADGGGFWRMRMAGCFQCVCVLPQI